MFGSKMEQEKKFDLSQKYSKRTKKKVLREKERIPTRALSGDCFLPFSLSLSLSSSDDA